MEKRLIDYIKLKRYLKKTGKTLNYTPEDLYNITPKDTLIITQYLNVTPRLAPNHPIHPVNRNILSKNQVFTNEPDESAALYQYNRFIGTDNHLIDNNWFSLKHPKDVSKSTNYLAPAEPNNWFSNRHKNITNFYNKPKDFHKPIINNINANDWLVLTDFNPDLTLKCLNSSSQDDLTLFKPVYNGWFKYYPDHTRKSIGYDQTCSHYFNVIDTDYQSPDHTVMYYPRGGESSRMFNKINKQDDKYIKF